MQLRENFIIFKFQLKSGSKDLTVSSSPSRSVVVKYGVHSVIRAIPSHTNTAFQTPIRVNHIMKQCRETYLEHRREETKSQCRSECYLALNRVYELAEYLSTVRDRKQRKILTRYRLSDHKLAIQKG